jgi:NADH-quinone oxidoreductase subunit F
MDIKLTGGAPSAGEKAAVDGLLGPPEEPGDHLAHGGRIARSRRPLLLPALHAIQDQVGWISRGGLDYASRRLGVPPAEAFGVATFYGRFALDPRPAKTLHVCDDIVCMCNGGGELLESHAGEAGVYPIACLGLCDHAPAALLERAGPAPASTQVGATTSRTVIGGSAGLRLLARVGVVDPGSIESYVDAGGGNTLLHAREVGPARFVAEVTEAGLVGRGGAGFPTGRKWAAVAAAAAQPHYFVCNADESEPGTFKDRVLLEEDPFAVVEAITVGAFATGSDKAYVYLRGEYPLARARIENAVAQAREHDWFGDRFDIEVFRGAWAYVCGEETALFNSIEGKRGEPRNKPPFPVERGLFGKPTAINNVETLVNVLDLVPESKASRLFCLSGHVRNPGVYEAPMDTRLGALIEKAGGVRDGHRLQTILLGGAAGTFLGPDRLELQLGPEALRAVGATLGSGAVMVFDETADLGRLLIRIARFFRHESCGQCVPCRVGTMRQEEIVRRIVSGNVLESRDREAALLNDVARAMRDASICGLGQTAANAIESGLGMLPR